MRSVTGPVASLSDLLTLHSAEQGGRPAFTFLESGEQDAGQLTWLELERASRSIAAAIRDRVEPGARVVLLFPPGIEFVTALFGAFRARVIAVPAYPPSGARSDRVAERLRGMLADAGVSLVLTTAAVETRAQALRNVIPELLSVQWLNVDEAVADRPGNAFDDAPTADDIAFLQYTSGSTSSPRGVMVTHANLLDNLAGSARLGLHDPSSVSVSWLPVNHDMGLIQGVLQPVFSGFSAWLMSPVAFLQRPARWLQAISRLRATHSGGPNFAYDLCVRRISALDREALDLTAWNVAFSGSEPVRESTIDEFHRTFSRCGFRRQAFRPAYGLAESTLLVTSTEPQRGPRTMTLDRAALRRGRVMQVAASQSGSPVVGCGSPQSTTRIAIVDPATCRRCAADEVGEIWVAGGSVARGYWRRVEETRSTFRAHLADTGEGPFLRTGDLGFLRSGELFVTGRIKDVIIVRGLKHHPHDVELSVEAADAMIRAGCVAAFTIDPESEAVALAAEVELRDDRPALNSLIETIRAAVATAHGIQVSTIVLLAPGSLSKTTSGKIQRFACREALRAGSLSAVVRWDESEPRWPLERTA